MDVKQEYELKKFNRLYKELDDIYHEIALKSGLSDSAFSILYTIAELGDGCLQKEIAEHNFMSKQTIHTSAKNLEREGYLSFRKGKGRDVHLCLTEAGKKLTREKILPVIRQENCAILEMSAEERDQLFYLMEKYVYVFRERTKEIL